MRVLVLSLLITFAAAMQMQALAARRKLQSGRSGFISIDCGIEEGTSRYDSTMAIHYVSDAEYIHTGINKNISQELPSETKNFETLLTTLRSFPEGENNCYSIKPQQEEAAHEGKKYLIRAFFMYGNYDSKNHNPTFKLFLDVNEWVTINITKASQMWIKEIIHKPKTDYIHICLVNIGMGTPFVSALELRELSKNIYETRSDESLSLFGRFNRGSNSDFTHVRYDDDFYDRIWSPSIFGSWIDISASYVNEKFSDNEYKPSATVMSTAVKPLNGSSLLFHPVADARNNKFHVYMYFLEVENLANNQTREFNIYLNDVAWPEPQTIVPDRYPKTILDPYSSGGIDSLNFSIIKTEDSTLPPIQNAIEYYIVKNFPESPTYKKNVDAMISIKEQYGIKKNWQGDPCVPEKFSWDGVECSKKDQGEKKISSLNLSCSGLTNQITSSFSQLDSLQILDLSNNSLVGMIPDFLAEMHSLTSLNLSGNKLNGSVPRALLEKVKSGSFSLSVDGNPDICVSGACEKKKKTGRPQKVVVILIVLTVSCLLVLAAIAIILRHKRKAQDTSVAHEEKEKSMKSRSKTFTYTEVVYITNNFQSVIGRGGSGVVYLGCLQDGSKVAVKMLSLSKDGQEQFQTEVQLLKRIYHGNLTSLVGYCNEGTNLALIYEYMAYGNLREHLSENFSNILSWKERVRIALDAAQGLEYLHNGCKPPIIHRDMKSTNILLNEKLQAKIADFGVSRIMASETDTHISTRVAGTHGYLDPEYSRTYKLSEKSDVYSFGVVLLELISGEPVFIEGSAAHIVTRVKKKLERGDIKKMVDPKLGGKFKINSAWKVLETAMACIPPTAVQRLNMSQVIAELKEALALELSNERGSGLKYETGRLRIGRDENEIETAPTAR